jgi:hypothetical protein
LTRLRFMASGGTEAGHRRATSAGSKRPLDLLGPHPQLIRHLRYADVHSRPT